MNSDLKQPASAIDKASPGWHPGRPPIPHEHGAWFILYVPLLIPLLAGSTVPLIPSLLLILVVTGSYLGQYAFRLTLRQHHKAGNVFWLAVYSIVVAVGLIGLLSVYRLTDLFMVGMMAGALFGMYTLLGRVLRGRFDRSQWGQILAIAALTLTTLAAYVVVYGVLGRSGWYIWSACILYFSSGVFYVRMLLSAARIKEGFDRSARWTVGRDVGLYHGLVIVVMAAVIVMIGGWVAWLVALAYAPVIVRAFYGWVTLTNTLPPLKRVGWKESGYSLWFMGVFQLAVRLSPWLQ